MAENDNLAVLAAAMENEVNLAEIRAVDEEIGRMIEETSQIALSHEKKMEKMRVNHEDLRNKALQSIQESLNEIQHDNDAAIKALEQTHHHQTANLEAQKAEELRNIEDQNVPMEKQLADLLKKINETKKSLGERRVKVAESKSNRQTAAEKSIRDFEAEKKEELKKKENELYQKKVDQKKNKVKTGMVVEGLNQKGTVHAEMRRIRDSHEHIGHSVSDIYAEINKFLDDEKNGEALKTFLREFRETPLTNFSSVVQEARSRVEQFSALNPNMRMQLKDRLEGINEMSKQIGRITAQTINASGECLSGVLQQSRGYQRQRVQTKKKCRE
ncbi:unnamed protein product [Caenorhabditis auriculariae]|uniref:Uncharacterized protein n=1 Tax=Caenorhabditis auriculariae TaxID=2777116 RepID=A0A8S1HUC3_9PELO|nr:unnamed protein product [Caenorhabditis auriculariae]